MNGYIVSVGFSATNEFYLRNVPRPVNMEFEEAMVFDAVDYFNNAWDYFKSAKKFDPNFHGVDIAISFWLGRKELKRIDL